MALNQSTPATSGKTVRERRLQGAARSLPAKHLRWRTASGGQLCPDEMTDTQLKRALAHGLRRAARHFRDLGMDCLAGAAGGDDGLAYLAETESDAHFARATDRRALFQHMATVPRYAAVMREVRSRVQAQRAFEQRLARHTPQ